MEARNVDVFHKTETINIIVDSIEKVKYDTPKKFPSIFMVPSRLRDLSPNSFSPRRVSIGPLHKQDEHVQEIEGDKRAICGIIISKVDSPQQDTVKACVEKVNPRLSDIRECYPVLNIYTDVELAKMMVMDACFILYILINCDWFSTEPGFASVLLTMVSDLVLLENQIPFFVLRGIFECTVLKFQPTTSLNMMLLKLLKVIKPFEAELNAEIHGRPNTDYKHILHFLHKSYEPTTSVPGNGHTVFVPPSYSVTELEKAGVKFMLNKDNKWPLAINFESNWRKPTLTLPLLSIDVYTELVFFNLIAFEKSPGYFTSYVVAMMNLIKTREDHLKLEGLKIARNNPSGPEYAVDLIRTLSKGSDLKEFVYFKEWEKINAYCNSPLGWTRRTYFSSAWSYIASVSALILFILTVIQTYCSIRGS